MENYKTIIAYPNYEVSNLGNVRRIGKDRPLNPFENGKGYLLVHLSNEVHRRLCLVHRLVMITHNPIEINMDVNHKDGDKSNNTLSNLEWTTKSDNTRHAHLTGLFSSRNKLTIEQVKEIRNSQLTQRELAAIHGVSRSVINKIINRKLYPYV